MELDVYLPELQLAFEYHGEQHYKPVYWTSDFAAQKKRDQDKVKECEKVKFMYWFVTIEAWNHFDRSSVLVGF